ncbi:MAG: hypothetical protein ABSA30_13230, partial [Candidatus Aminicenantales bacterium]
MNGLDSLHAVKARNPKSEIRNKSKMRNLNVPSGPSRALPDRAESACQAGTHVSVIGRFGHWKLFPISRFGFRASFLVLSVLLLAGCPSADRSSSGRAGGGRPDAAVQYADEMINHGIETLDRLEEFEAGEVCSQIVGRIVEMSHTRRLPAQGQSDPLLATCPEPEMLRQTVDRLNQWGQSQQAPADWKLDPLVRELPPSLADVPVVRDLGKIQFSVYDGFSLLEALWLRDLSQWARGTQADEL